MDSRLEQAKEWAWEVTAERIPDTPSGRAKLAAAKVIQSLPDQWIDAEGVREFIEEWRTDCPAGDGPQILDQLESLLAPPLPTLTELIEAGNDPQDYQWMQCNVEGRGDDTFVIASVRELVTKVLLPDGMHEVKGNSQVTPLPDLPKLEWPGSHVDTITAESVEDMQAGRVADFEPALPRPEDVPSGEAWLVRYKERGLVAYKADLDDRPWVVQLSDKGDHWWLSDADITLISRLVPEDKENA